MHVATFDIASMTGMGAEVEVQKKKKTNSEETDGKSFVTQRIINVCNGLLGKAVEVKTVGSFK